MRNYVKTCKVNSACPYGSGGRGEHTDGEVDIWYDDYETSSEIPRWSLHVSQASEFSDELDEDGLGMMKCIEVRATRSELESLRDAMTEALLKHPK